MTNLLAMLNEWLKSIIIIILIAAFVDLILPNHSMQRYVKVVVSLFVLLTILTPIVKIIVSDFGWEKFEFPDTPLDSIVASAVPLKQVEREGEALRMQTEQQALGIVTSQIEQLMSEQVVKIAGHSLQNVQVSLTVTEEGEPRLELVTITLDPDNMRQYAAAQTPTREDGEQHESNGSTSVSEEPLVAEVERVQIDSVSAIDLQGKKEERSNKHTDPKQSQVHESVRQLEQLIREELQREWGLASEQIRFRY